MGKNKRKFFNTDSFGIILLLILTIFAGYMGCNQRFLDGIKEEKVTTNSKNYNRSGYSDYDYDSDYDDEYYGNYDDYYSGYNNYDDYYDYDGDYDRGYEEEYESNYTGYKNYDEDYDYYYDDYDRYNDTDKPAIKYNSSETVYQYQKVDIWKGVKASHSKFGDVTDFIEIIYNNVDTSTPGEYSIVYKACNYPGSSYCRTATKKIIVKQKEDPNGYNTKAPVWSDNLNKSCYEGDSSCSTNRINEPTAKDPWTNRYLDVTLIDGYVDIYTPGSYVLVYYAETENGVSGTTTKIITIEEKYSNNNKYDDDDDYYYDDDNYQDRKYIDEHDESYYDDGRYRGSLKPNYNNRQISKYIQNYKWTNKVYYTYRCDVEGQTGTNGWTYVSTDTSDNNPTIQYNIGGFSGQLEKTDFYCVQGQGCESDVNRQLGICNNVGQTKQITRSWVGVYSGYVYTNNEETYSGYVYRYR